MIVNWHGNDELLEHVARALKQLTHWCKSWLPAPTSLVHLHPVRVARFASCGALPWKIFWLLSTKVCVPRPPSSWTKSCPALVIQIESIRPGGHPACPRTSGDQPHLQQCAPCQLRTDSGGAQRGAAELSPWSWAPSRASLVSARAGRGIASSRGCLVRLLTAIPTANHVHARRLTLTPHIASGFAPPAQRVRMETSSIDGGQSLALPAPHRLPRPRSEPFADRAGHPGQGASARGSLFSRT